VGVEAKGRAGRVAAEAAGGKRPDRARKPRADAQRNRDRLLELSPNADGTSWTEHTLHIFCSRPACADGALPAAGLIMGASGNLYGTTSSGGSSNNGTVFEVTP
jgi:uncharacterized repeat protein (TIGR03803 family)